MQLKGVREEIYKIFPTNQMPDRYMHNSDIHFLNKYLRFFFIHFYLHIRLLFKAIVGQASGGQKPDV